MSSLRFFSMFGFVCSVYLVLVITCIFWFEHNMIELGERLSKSAAWGVANKYSFDFEGIVIVLPFIIFAYMYQPNIPGIYRELKTQTFNQMFKVLLLGSLLVIFIYMGAATFGYLTWAGSKEEETL